MVKKDKAETSEMGFLDHLEELRWVLVRAAAGILLAAIGAFVSYRFIFDYVIFGPKSPDFVTNRVLCLIAQSINAPALCINSKPLEIININMAGQFNTHLMVSLYAGIIVAFPYIIFQLWNFVKPALYEHERKRARGAVFYISLLFFVGVCFGFFIIAPFTIHFLGTYRISPEVTNQINLGSYLSSVAAVTLAVGLLFELPILILFLTKANIVSPTFLKKYRKHAFIVIMVIAAIITPPDVFSLILVTIPMWLLYEFSIFISSRHYRRNTP